MTIPEDAIQPDPLHRSEPSQDNGTSAWMIVVPMVLLVIIVATLVYWPMLGSGFMFDDFVNIVDNRALHVTRLVYSDWVAALFSSPASSIARPLAMFTFALNHYFTGLNPEPMKLTNLVIHLVNIALVAMLASRLLAAAHVERIRAAWATALIAACWGLMPINQTVVLLTVQRMEALAQTFVLIGLACYIAGRQRNLVQSGTRGWLLIVGGLSLGTVLGCLAKETAALLPVYALAVEATIFQFRGANGERDRRVIGVFLLFVAAPAVLGIAWIAPHVLTAKAYAVRDFTLPERVMTEWRVLTDYLMWTLWPRLNQLSLYHDTLRLSRSLLDPASTLLCGLFLVGLMVLAWAIRRVRPLASLGIALFFVAHLLTATIIPLELVFEHRNYFASLGVCLVLADLLVIAPSRETTQRWGALAGIVFCLYYGGIALLRSSEWRDPFHFALSESRSNPHSPRATYEFARTLVIIGKYRPSPEIAALTQKALADARRENTKGILAYQASLIYAARTGAPVDRSWWTGMQERLATQPIGAQELGALAALTSCVRQRHCDFSQQDMLDTYGSALKQGDQPEVLNMFASYASSVLADPALAKRLWLEAVRLRPAEGQYRINLIRLLVSTGQFDEAAEDIALLRNVGKFGQYQSAADGLARSLAASKAAADAGKSNAP